MANRRELTAKMVATGPKVLASPPTLYLRLRQLLNDPKYTLGDMANLVATDPSLTARMLRIANSACFGGLKEVDTVRWALVVLGSRQVHDIVLATS